MGALTLSTQTCKLIDTMGAKPRIREELKRKIARGCRAGIPNRLLAELFKVSEGTIQNYRDYDPDGEGSTFEVLAEVMEDLRKKFPAEWIKRSRHKQHFASVDKLEIPKGADERRSIIIIEDEYDDDC